MKNQTAAKVALLLGGVMARLAENFAFFKQIDIVFRSGRKAFSATVTAQAADSFLIRYNGTQMQTDGMGFPPLSRQSVSNMTRCRLSIRSAARSLWWKGLTVV